MQSNLPEVFTGELSSSTLGVVAVLLVSPVTAVVLVVALPGAEDAAAVAATELGGFAETQIVFFEALVKLKPDKQLASRIVLVRSLLA